MLAHDNSENKIMQRFWYLCLLIITTLDNKFIAQLKNRKIVNGRWAGFLVIPGGRRLEKNPKINKPPSLH